MQSSSSNSTSSTDARTVVVLSVSVAMSMEVGMVARSFGNSAMHAVHNLDNVRAGLPLNVDNDGWRFIHPGGQLYVFDAVHHVRHILQHDRSVVLERDNDVVVILGG